MAQDERLEVKKTRQHETGQQTYPEWTDGPQTTSDGRPPPSARDDVSITSTGEDQPHVEKWSLGILNDRYTEEVPGTVLLLTSNRNEPLGVEHEAARHSESSMPNQGWASRAPSRRPSSAAEKKKTADGKIVLEPQPEDSANDPLNWPAWRRDCALLSLGLYCMIGGGMTPILAAGFNNVAQAFNVTYEKVALTTGLYMMGLGVGSVINSPTAILFGKRPVYLFSAVMFVATSIWCAASPSYGSLATARVFQGIAASPVECLPSASIAEIFFLHERAFRIGIYTLLLLSGKNLVPLVSAAILQSMSWRWVFYIAAIVVGFAGILLFCFVPETFWDRTPRPRSRRPTMLHRSVSSLLRQSISRRATQVSHHDEVQLAEEHEPTEAELEKCMTPRQVRLHSHNVHAHFAEDDTPAAPTNEAQDVDVNEKVHSNDEHSGVPTRDRSLRFKRSGIKLPAPLATAGAADPSHVDSEAGVPHLHNLNSPYYTQLEKKDVNYLSHHTSNDTTSQPRSSNLDGPASPSEEEKQNPQTPRTPSTPGLQRYTTRMRVSEPKSYTEILKPWNGRVSQTKWWKAALRPFVLYAYPSVLWSSLVYSLSIGWLIVLSESVSKIYRNKESYNFSALGTGLVYLSPFIGGVLGTAVAGKVSDVIVQYMARRNGGVYEPEFRLVMAAPVAVTTAIGLMGYGWSAQERDMWIVPTVFFGIISFGCSLGSTTAITFCVDSYRQYAGEALVTLNFAKNIFHGLVFSLFFSTWLEDDGPKDVFLAIGGIQIACLLTTIPMYIYGKRSRMWTVRKNLMENL